MKVSKRKGPKMVIPKKENFLFGKVSKHLQNAFLKISFFGITIFGSFLFKTFISAPSLIFGIFENLHKSIIDFLILTRSRGKKIISDSEPWETSPSDL